MSVADFRSKVIPEIKRFTGVPIIEGDHTGDTIDGPHATYKITSSYSKDVGQADITTVPNGDGIALQHFEQYRATVSITTYAFDDPEKGVFDLAENLSQQIYDWFLVFGGSLLDSLGIVVIEQTDVTNRDAIIVEEYERRFGFDVIMRMSRKLTNSVDYFENVKGITD